MTDLAALTDADLDALRLAVLLEQERRNIIATAEARAADLVAQYAQAIGRRPGDPYQPVSGAHDAYTPGSIVSDDDAYYRATGWASNPPGQGPWERVWPDGDGWTTTPPADDEPLPWAVGISAVGPADPDGKPQTVLSHEGRLWRCKVTHVTHSSWAPSAATYAVWEDIGPA